MLVPSSSATLGKLEHWQLRTVLKLVQENVAALWCARAFGSEVLLSIGHKIVQVNVSSISAAYIIWLVVQQ